MRCPQLRRQTGMVRQRRPALITQPGSSVFHLAARQAVDNTGVAPVLAQKALQLLTRFVLGHNAVEDIRAIKAGDKAGSMFQLQALHHFATGALIGGCGQRHARHARKLLGQLAQLQVFRAEIMPPLGDAVRLVNGKQSNLQRLQKGDSARLEQALRRQIEKLQLTGAHLPGDLALGIFTECGVERSGAQAQFVERGNLIIHQRNQR